MDCKRLSVSLKEDIVIHTNKQDNAVIMVETVKNPRFSVTSLKSSTSKLSFSHRGSIFAQTVLTSIRKLSVQTKLSVFRSFRGVFLAAISALLFSTDATLVKSLTGTEPAFIALIQGVGAWLLAIAALSNIKESIFGPPKLRFWLILRGFIAATTWYFRYKTLHLLPLANATIITLSMPVFVCIFARIFLKEPFGLFHSLALLFTATGILFTANIGTVIASFTAGNSHTIDLHQQLLGLAFGILTAIFGGLSITLVRHFKDVNHTVVVFNFAWTCVLESAIITYAKDEFKIPKCGYDAWILVLIGVFTYFGQVMLTKALQVEEAAIVAMTRSSLDIILAFIFQITIFLHTPNVSTIIGAILVAGSVILINLRKYIETLSPDHFLRRWFSFTLK